MRSYRLGFISDKDIYQHTKNTVEKYRFSINLNEFKKNIVDPIKLTFDSKIYNRDIDEMISIEALRQIDKSNTNHIGYFHQNIFKYMGNGWSVPEKGYDVINENLNYYAEIKNKHNTMNSSSSQKTYMKMQSTLLENDEATCFLVEVLAKASQNINWVISVDGQQKSHKKIRRISIDKFYELVTGKKTAFRDLCSILPQVINDVVSQKLSEQTENSVLSELLDISPNILKSLYMISFKEYEGFGEFVFSKH